MPDVRIPQVCLVVLIGTSGAGKSTFAARHFGRFETISSDFCRGLVSDDENDQAASGPAFDVLGYIAGKRLAAGRLTVIDATNVQKESRAQFVRLAREHDVLPVAIVLDVPEATARERNVGRADRDFGPHVIRRQRQQLRKSINSLVREGFRRVITLTGVAEIEQATIVRERMLNDYRHQSGPFDVIGDIHGCSAELRELLERLGYAVINDEHGRAVDAAHPEGRRVVFLGDLVDRGPDSPGVLRLAMGMVRAGHAFAVPGNHEAKLVRALDGRQVQRTHGLAETLEQLDAESAEFRSEVRDFCAGLVSHLLLDEGRLVVAHAGLKEAYHGRASGRVRSFALYGDTTGETDEFGLPVRYPWAVDYRGRAMVLYGHTPTPETEWVNNTMCLDTGCVFGGELTALRYPERETVSVPATRVYYEPVRPLRVEPSRRPDDLDITDVLGKRVVETGWHGRVTVRAEQAAGAIEVISRFAIDPRALPYLPPTMAPVPTSAERDLLEHPEEAFAEFAGVEEVVCQEKHMGSRAVVLVCRREEVAERRFGIEGPEAGVVYTRTGRPFLSAELRGPLLDRVRTAIGAAGLWDQLETDWLLLDTEILPWSAKAEGLLKEQYAAVGAAATAALPAVATALASAAARGLDVAALTERVRVRDANAREFVDTYRGYCWPTAGLTGLAVAPFQILAGDGSSWATREHAWHLDLIDRLVDCDPGLFRPTQRLFLDPRSPEDRARGVQWWQQLTAAGGEGMVVKPAGGPQRGPRGLVQPGLKVRGPAYLRLIYGPDYLLPDQLARLRQRRLGHKASLALREYALGLEALDRLARGEPLWRVHEPVFAVLALESEPVDPRL